MARVIILGSSNFVPDIEHGNTHLLINAGELNVLVDCAGDVIQRLQKIQMPFDQITDLILTHFHPDHISGAPLLLMGMWIMGRKRPLNIYGISHTIYRIQALMDFYEWQTWPNFYPVSFIQVEEKGFAPVIDAPNLSISAYPVKHFIPTVGLRVEFKQSGKSLAYSCDTEPCQAVELLAKDVDVLIHESTGGTNGHSSSVQAAEVAKKARAKELYLIHYQERGQALEKMVRDAENVFPGPVHLAKDFATIPFD